MKPILSRSPSGGVPPTTAARPRACASAFGRDRRGGVALMLGLAAPVAVGLVGAAVDYAVWSRQVRTLQNAADAAALAATVELSVSAAGESRVQAIANAVVASHLSDDGAADRLVVEARLQANASGVRVVLRQPTRIYLSQILSPVPGAVEVSATAAMSGRRKVCVLALEGAKSGALMLDASAQLTGKDCAVHSNSRDSKGFASKSSAVVTSPFMCSSGGFEGGVGNFSGPRLSDCPPLPDPLANRLPPTVRPCTTYKEKLVIGSGSHVLPGDTTYCGGIEIKGSGTRVTLSAGIHTIKDGQLKVDDSATLYGRNVGIYFTGKDANFDFLSSSVIDLGAPKDGDMAGILFYGDRAAPDTREYKITSDYANTLLGTVYIPQGFLTVDAKAPVADRSAYTAIVARRIELKQSPNLVLNANYGGTDVPVPKGLAPNADVRLVN